MGLTANNDPAWPLDWFNDEEEDHTLPFPRSDLSVVYIAEQKEEAHHELPAPEVQLGCMPPAADYNSLQPAAEDPNSFTITLAGFVHVDLAITVPTVIQEAYSNGAFAHAGLDEAEKYALQSRQRSEHDTDRTIVAQALAAADSWWEEFMASAHGMAEDPVNDGLDVQVTAPAVAVPSATGIASPVMPNIPAVHPTLPAVSTTVVSLPASAMGAPTATPN